MCYNSIYSSSLEESYSQRQKVKCCSPQSRDRRNKELSSDHSFYFARCKRFIDWFHGSVNIPNTTIILHLKMAKITCF